MNILFLLFSCLILLIGATTGFSAETLPMNPEFIDRSAVYVGLAVIVFEYLVANMKIKSNSTIDLIINTIKMIFRTDRYSK